VLFASGKSATRTVEVMWSRGLNDGCIAGVRFVDQAAA
jgi:hypothetical protein